MPAPLDPRWPHVSRLNPLERPDRRWRCKAQEMELDHVPQGGRDGRP